MTTTPEHVHFIRDGRFICTADQASWCRNYPGCECEQFDPELHGDQPAPGHEPVPQPECLIEPWITCTDLCDTYEDGEHPLVNEQFPDGPIGHTWEIDYLTWSYANDQDAAEVLTLAGMGVSE